MSVGMRRLILLRHAKSAWDDAALADHDRPLARRGRLAATLMGAWLAEIARVGRFRIDAALVSSSRRTRETWDRLALQLGSEAPTPRIEPTLYEAAPGAVLGLVQASDPALQTLLVVAHDPGLPGLARLLALDAPARMPTGAAVALVFEGPWVALGPAGARVELAVEPKALV